MQNANEAAEKELTTSDQEVNNRARGREQPARKRPLRSSRSTIGRSTAIQRNCV